MIACTGYGTWQRRAVQYGVQHVAEACSTGYSTWQRRAVRGAARGRGVQYGVRHVAESCSEE